MNDFKGFTQEQINSMIAEARTTARQAAQNYLAQYGDRDACGFASVKIAGVKGNTKLGKMLKAAGVRQSWDKTYEIWNPSGLGVQSISVLEAGADAAARTLKELGFDAYSWSRMD